MEYLGNLYDAIISSGIENISPAKYAKLKEYLKIIQTEPEDFAPLCDKYVAIKEFLSMAQDAINTLSKSHNTTDLKRKDELQDQHTALTNYSHYILSLIEILVDNGAELSLSEGIGYEFGVIIKKNPLKYDAEFETIKQGILIDEKLLPDAPNKKNSFFQNILIYPFAPLYPSTTLSDIANRFFYIKANIGKPSELADAIKSGYFIINKITPDAKEYNIWKLIDKTYVEEHGLEYNKENGVSPIVIERMKNITEYNNDYTNIDIEYDIKDKNIVLDTFDGKTYRLLAKSGEVLVDGEWLRKLINPQTSTPKTLECYNRLLEQEYFLQDPVDVMGGKNLDWRGIIEQLVNDINIFLHKTVGKEQPTAKLLVDAIRADEFRVKIRSNISKYIQSKDIKIKEVLITAENELNAVIRTLVDKLSKEFKSSRNIYKERDPISKIMFKVRNVLSGIFNANNNLFTAIHQKYLVCTSFKH